MKSGVDRTIFHIIFRAQNYFLGRSAVMCKSRNMITWDCSTIWIRCVSRVRRLRSHKHFAPCRKIWMNHNLSDWLPFIYTSHSSLDTRPDMKPFLDQDAKPQSGTPVSSKSPNRDLEDIDVLCTFKIKIESQNFESGCTKGKGFISGLVPREEWEV